MRSSAVNMAIGFAVGLSIIFAILFVLVFLGESLKTSKAMTKGLITYSCNTVTNVCLPAPNPDAPDKTKVQTLDSCTTDCTPVPGINYTCDNFACTQYDGNPLPNSYNTRSRCEQECKDDGKRYSCNLTTGSCKEDPNGSYLTLPDCNMACNIAPPPAGSIASGNYIISNTVPDWGTGIRYLTTKTYNNASYVYLAEMNGGAPFWTYDANAGTLMTNGLYASIDSSFNVIMTSVKPTYKWLLTTNFSGRMSTVATDGSVLCMDNYNYPNSNQPGQGTAPCTDNHNVENFVFQTQSP